MKKSVKKTEKNFLWSIKPKKSNLIYWIAGVVVVIILLLLLVIILSEKKEIELKGELASLTDSGEPVGTTSLLSSYAPKKIVLGKKFNIICDFGVEGLNCIAASHGGNSCPYLKFEGTKGIFECTANSLGIKENKCDLFFNEDTNHEICKNEQDIIQNTKVISEEERNNEFKEIKSVTWYPPRNNNLNDVYYNSLVRELPKIKSRGFNTIWIVLPWYVLEPKPLAEPPEYNEAEFETVKKVLKLLKENDMKVIIGLPYLGGKSYLEGGWSPEGIEACKLLTDSIMYNAFEKYSFEVMRRFNDYNNIIYYHVFSENVIPCGMSGLDGLPTDTSYPEVSRIVRATLGSLPKRIPNDIRNDITIGFHQRVEELNYDKYIDEPISFDFLSTGNYDLEKLTAQEIINKLNSQKNMVKSFYSNIPFILGEFGTSYCLKGESPAIVYDESTQAKTNNEIIKWALDNDIGFNLWEWAYIENQCISESGKELYKDYSVTNPDGSFRQSARELSNLLCRKDNCICNENYCPLLWSNLPEKTRVKQTFQIKCDFGERLPCIAPVHAGVGCTWHGWDGETSTAIFDCTADKVGTQENTCNLFDYSPNPKCKSKIFRIDSIFVDLKSSFVPERVNLGQNFQIGCDFGERLPCVAPVHAGVGCSWHGWDGDTSMALFNCIANRAGTQKNTCNLFDYSENSKCKTGEFRINDISVN